MSSSTFRTTGQQDSGPDGPKRGGARSLAGELGRVGDALGRLLRDHVDLARVELRGEAREVTIDAAIGLAAIPFALAGLIMLDVALSIGLSSWIGGAWSFVIVGVLNVGLASFLGLFAATRLRKQRKLEGLADELQENRALLYRLRGQLRGGHAPREPFAPGGSAPVGPRPNRAAP